MSRLVAPSPRRDHLFRRRDCSGITGFPGQAKPAGQRETCACGDGRPSHGPSARDACAVSRPRRRTRRVAATRRRSTGKSLNACPRGWRPPSWQPAPVSPSVLSGLLATVRFVLIPPRFLDTQKERTVYGSAPFAFIKSRAGQVPGLAEPRIHPWPSKCAQVSELVSQSNYGKQFTKHCFLPNC